MRVAGVMGPWAGLLLLLSGCSSGEAPAPATSSAASGAGPVAGGWVVVPLEADPLTFNWVVTNDVATTRVARLIGDSLVDHGPDLAFIPRLAREWTVEDGGRRLTFSLRRDVVWHDGEPFDSEDVLFTYRLAMDPEIGAGVFAAYFSDVISVEAPDEHTVSVTYGSPFSPALLQRASGGPPTRK